MKLAILPMICMLVGISLADQPRDMRDRELGAWKINSADQGHTLEQSVSEKEGRVLPHWKVVDVGSGQVIWSGDPRLEFVPWKEEVFIAPGGRNIAIINRYLFFRGQPKDVAEQKVLWLFQESAQTKGYSLHNLGLAESDVKRSFSHIHAFPNDYNFQNHTIPADRGLVSSNTGATKLFGGDDSSVTVTFRCGLRVKIGFKNKEIQETERLITKEQFSNLGDNWYKF